MLIENRYLISNKNDEKTNSREMIDAIYVEWALDKIILCFEEEEYCILRIAIVVIMRYISLVHLLV